VGHCEHFGHEVVVVAIVAIVVASCVGATGEGVAGGHDGHVAGAGVGHSMLILLPI
jgi:hypothetical protein